MLTKIICAPRKSPRCEPSWTTTPDTIGVRTNGCVAYDNADTEALRIPRLQDVGDCKTESTRSGNRWQFWRADVPRRFLPLALCVVPPLPFILCVFREEEQASDAEISWSLRDVGVARVPTGMVNLEGQINNTVFKSFECVSWASKKSAPRSRTNWLGGLVLEIWLTSRQARAPSYLRTPRVFRGTLADRSGV